MRHGVAPTSGGKDLSSEIRVILTRYPRSVELRDGTRVTLRALVPSHAAKLVQLFADIPYEELRNLHDNVSDSIVVRRWCANINYDRVLPIVAEVDGRFVADATLHRRLVGPMPWLGRFRAYVRPEFRRRGLGAVLLEEVLSVAGQLGVKQLAVEIYADQETLKQVFLRYGFREEGRVPIYQRVILARSVASGDTGAEG